VKGRAYVREMKALSLTAGTKAQALAEAPDEIEAAGFVLTKQNADEMRKMGLEPLRPRRPRTVLGRRGDGARDARLRKHLKTLGIDAAQVAKPGYADMMVEPHYCKVPGEAIAGIVEWVAGAEIPPLAPPSKGGEKSLPTLGVSFSGGERPYPICATPEL